MNSSTLRRVVLSLCASTLLATPAMASAESVAYIDGNEVWASTIDGSRKVRLSAGQNQWRDVANASGGTVVGVEREANKIAQLSFFTQWDANGAFVRSGILPNAHTGWSLAAPLNIDVTPDGGAMVWGYSALQLFPTSILDQGTYFTSTQNVAGLQPLTMPGERYPTLAGKRLVSSSGRTIRAMNDVPSAPFSNQATDFANWLDLSSVLDASWDLGVTATSNDGRIAAFHFTQFTGGTLTGGRIGVVGTQGLGLALTGSPDCWLPTVGIAKSEPSISADGTLIAWQDDQGVKVAPVPTGTADPCVFPAAPTVISATGIEPDLGGFIIPATPAPAPGAGGGTPPTTTTPTTITTLKTAVAATFVTKGIPVTVTPGATGKVIVQITVPGRLVGLPAKKTVIIATATRVIAAGVRTKLLVRPLAKYRAKVKRLKGKRVTVRVTIGGKVTVRTMTLR